MAENALGIEDDPNVVNLDEATAAAEEAQAVGWPLDLERAYQTVLQAKPEKVVNSSNLGDMRFTEADSKLADVVQVLRDLRLEEWRLVRADLSGQIAANTQGMVNTITAMAELKSSQPDAQAQRDNHNAQFESYYRFFMDQVRPICTTARVEEALRNRRDLLTGDLSQERVEELQATVQKLRAEVAEFGDLSALISAQRQLVGKEGISDLSQHFTKLASASKEEFETWGKRLGWAVGLGGIAAAAFVYATRPDNDAQNAEVVTHVFLDVLVVGLVVFVIRFLALQSRAYRHVEFTSRNKANALSTFNLVVAGQDDEAVRSQVAAALAQAVFKSDDGIFSDASSDTVTIIERVIGAASSRVTPGS